MKIILLLSLFFFSCHYQNSFLSQKDLDQPASQVRYTITNPVTPSKKITTLPALYSPWVLIDSSQWRYAKDSLAITPSGDTLITFHAAIVAPSITQNAIDSGRIYYFIRDSANNFLKETGKINSFDPGIGAWVGAVSDSTLQFRIVGYRTNNTVGKIPLSIVWKGWNQNMGITSRPSIKELPPKTRFYLRYIILPDAQTAEGKKRKKEYYDYAGLVAYYRIPE